MLKKALRSGILLLCFLFSFPAGSAPAGHFQVIPLGVSGGELENNLSSYLVAPIHSNEFVALDAGTLCSSIKNISDATLKQLHVEPQPNQSLQEIFFKQHIQAYLLSHAHLDHISGLVLCSTIDSKKLIIGTESTIQYLKDNIFNWKIWPNFSDAGVEPFLKQYHYQPINFRAKIEIPATQLAVQAFPLNHGKNYPSTAFLLSSGGFYLLYVGDTGADAIEKSQDLHQLWVAMAPLIHSHKLTAIFMESSYTNQQTDQQLYGHLNPQWLLTELHDLAVTVNPKDPQQALNGLKIIVIHVKQGLEPTDNAAQILKELKTGNNLGVKFIIPQQREMLEL